jgi:hypothetical protein
MKYTFRRGVIVLTGCPYEDNQKFDLVSGPEGDVLFIIHKEQNKREEHYYQFGQFLISTDPYIYQQVLKGVKCEAFLKFILKTHDLDDAIKQQLRDSIVLFNIYTFSLSLVDRKRFKAIYGDFSSIEILSRPVPNLVAIRLDDRIVHIPDNFCRLVYNVKAEVLAVQPTKDWPDLVPEFDLFQALVRKPYSE